MVSPSRRCAQSLLFALVLLAAGCSAGKGSISGKVSLNGTPVAGGTITFQSEVGNREVFSALIKDGQYSIEGVPTGKARVTVKNLGPGAGGKQDGNRAASQGASPIPARYADPDSSGLSLTVRPGEQSYPVDLTP